MAIDINFGSRLICPRQQTDAFVFFSIILHCYFMCFVINCVTSFDFPLREPVENMHLIGTSN